MWRHTDVTKRDARIWRVISQHFLNMKKMEFFNFWLRAHLAYKMNHIKIYKKWSNLNTVKISFHKVAMPLIKFAIKDVKMTKKNVKNWLPYPYLAPYNRREED